ncbi:MAG: chemotaxis protein CheW [Rhodanobacteraceae bacterium]|nr:chemotaxis protein CheW [Rhodanobacteraceae bacterium]
MLALAFRAGAAELAIRARQVIEVLPRVPLRETSLAPAAVVGLLPYRGTLTPVVDLCLLVAGRHASAQLGTRIIVVRIGDGAAQRMVGLIAEDVSELLELGGTTPGLNLPDQPWLGAHMRDQPGLPQLVEPGELLPEALRALFCQEAPP